MKMVSEDPEMESEISPHKNQLWDSFREKSNKFNIIQEENIHSKFDFMKGSLLAASSNFRPNWLE